MKLKNSFASAGRPAVAIAFSKQQGEAMKIECVCDDTCIYIEYFNILYKLYMLYKLEIFVYIYMLNCYIYTVFGDAT